MEVWEGNRGLQIMVTMGYIIGSGIGRTLNGMKWPVEPVCVIGPVLQWTVGQSLNAPPFLIRKKGIGDAGSTADFRMLWSPLVMELSLELFSRSNSISQSCLELIFHKKYRPFHPIQGLPIPLPIMYPMVIMI